MNEANKDEMPPLDALAKALALAQAEMQNPPLDSVNPHFKSRYASLAAVRDAVIPVLAKHGLSIIQNITYADGLVSCASMLLHESGQRLSLPPFSVPASRNDPQGVCAASTYARRFNLQSVACVVGDDDDDGNAATKAHSESQQRPMPAPKPTPPAPAQTAPALANKPAQSGKLSGKAFFDEAAARILKAKDAVELGSLTDSLTPETLKARGLSTGEAKAIVDIMSIQNCRMIELMTGGDGDWQKQVVEFGGNVSAPLLGLGFDAIGKLSAAMSKSIGR